MNDHPNIQLCVQLGLIKLPAVPERGFTQKGQPRKYRKGQLTATEYTRLHRAKLYAAGLTARGTKK